MLCPCFSKPVVEQDKGVDWPLKHLVVHTNYCFYGNKKLAQMQFLQLKYLACERSLEIKRKTAVL